MLLDLTAAQLEGKPVPVSSLCIAAAVPTTTALRWIRSLSEAGLFERRVDPSDARRTYINLSSDAASAMLGYLRGFSAQFSPR
jgi:DNA-binding MarR family transcriptional regulator